MAEPVQQQGKADNGSADAGARQPGNAEDSLQAAFSAAAPEGAKDAGAAGAKPDAKTGDGAKEAGGAGTGGGAVKLAPWAEQLPPEFRDNPERAAKLVKFQKVGDMAKAYLDLAEAQSGKPETAEGYSFAGDKAHDGGEFARLAFAANLTAAQAEALYKGLGETGAEKARAYQEARDRQLKETSAALRKEYGARYPEKMELLTRGLSAAGPNVAAILAQAGLSGSPEIVKAFIAFGQMTAESGGARGGGAGLSPQSVFEGGAFEDYKNLGGYINAS